MSRFSREWMIEGAPVKILINGVKVPGGIFEAKQRTPGEFWYRIKITDDIIVWRKEADVFLVSMSYLSNLEYRKREYMREVQNNLNDIDAEIERIKKDLVENEGEES